MPTPSLDPPSPTTISMLSIDNINEDGHITPFSFASSVYDDNFETRSQVMTPLALFSKSMRDLQHGNSTSNIAAKSKKKPEVFVFPIVEGDESGSNDNISLATSIVNSAEKQEDVAKTSGAPLSTSNPSAKQTKLTSPDPNPSDAWPFANKPPSSSGPTVERKSPLEAWPFANKPPSSSGPTIKSPLEAWPFANKPPSSNIKFPLANGKVLSPPSTLEPSFSDAWPRKSLISPVHSGKARSFLSKAITAADKTPQSPEDSLKSGEDRSHTPSPPSADRPTISLLPPTPPLEQKQSASLPSNALQNMVGSPKYKPSPLTLALNTQHVGPLNANRPRSSLIGSPKSLLTSPPYNVKSPLSSPGHARRAPLSPTPLSPLSSPCYFKGSPISPRHIRKVAHSPVLSPRERDWKSQPYSPLTSPQSSKKSPLLSPLLSPQHRKLQPQLTSPLQISITPPISPQQNKKTPLGSPLPSMRGSQVTSPPQTALLSPLCAKETPLHFKRSPAVSPALRGKITPFTSPLPGRRSALNDEPPTVSLEPGRFDVASIYSARSMGSVVAHRTASTKKPIIEEVSLTRAV